MRITILNWDKYNPSKKKQQWFRVQNEMLTSQSLHKMTPTERYCLMCIFSVASTMGTGCLDVDLEWASRRYHVALRSLISCLRVAHECAIVQVDEIIEFTKVDGHVLNAPTIRNDTIRDDIYIAPLSKGASQPLFDFEKLYQNYPRKRGKVRGLKKCRSQIKTQEHYNQLELAINNYAKECAGKETEFIKYFDSFMSSWTDWVDYQPEHTNLKKPEIKLSLGDE